MPPPGPTESGARAAAPRLAGGAAVGEAGTPAPPPRSLSLATRMAGAPLDAGHGYPVRLVVPGERGFNWVKWVVAIEVDDQPWWWQPPFPLQ